MDADTPGSLRVRLFGFPIVINWSVLFIGALIATSRLPIPAVLLFFPAAILSILIHELGHAAVARSFGARVDSVLLYMMGGLTSWYTTSRLTRLNRIAISAAGSGVEIVLGLGVFALMRAGALGDVAADLMSHPFDTFFWQAGYAQQYVAYTAGVFVWVSVVWGLLNWLPIGGFDGSYMLGEFMVQRSAERGHDIARGISIAVSAVVFLYLYSTGYRSFALLIALIAVSSLVGSKRY